MKSSRSATTPDRRLVVHVPALESLLREASRRPALVDRLTRPKAAERIDAEHAGAFSVTGHDLPVAPLTRLRDYPNDAEGTWMRADPIGLTPDLAAVWLQTDRQFPPGTWQSEVVSLMADEGFQLEFHASGRGYLRLEAAPDCRFAAPSKLAGNSLEYCLPEGPAAGTWRRLLNETQVLLHQHAASAEPVPGSLWFWGAGSLPSAGSVTPRVDRIVSSDPVLEGVAQWLDLPCATRHGTDALCAANLLEWPVDFEAPADDNLTRLNADLQRAWRQLRFARIGTFELAGDDSYWTFRPLDAWRIWR